jgi:uncharacterized membrane protein (DUF373 family)
MAQNDSSTDREELPVFRAVAGVLSVAERSVFAIVGILLFAAALGLAWHSIFALMAIFVGPAEGAIDDTAAFLDLVLLILMIGEIAYTVTLSVRGRVLRPEPFLIVGLIAVIRRILVSTVHEVRNVDVTGWVSRSTLELLVLALVVLIFIIGLYVIRKQRTASAPEDL